MHPADLMIRRLLKEEAGLGLTEMLVALACSTIVLLGLSKILVSTMRQTAQTFTQVDANRQGRTALANIENELHSACTGASEAPIQMGSTATSLDFVSYYGNAAVPTPIWHVITFSPAANTLTDSSYAVAGSAPNYTQGSFISSNQLLSNVSQSGTTPVFQYFSYAAGSNDSGGTFWYVPDGINADPGTGTVPAASPLADSSGLSSQSANNTVEVLITLTAGATSETINNTSLPGVTAAFSDAVSLRLTTPPDEYTGTVSVASGAVPSGYGPCQ